MKKKKRNLVYGLSKILIDNQVKNKFKHKLSAEKEKSEKKYS